MSWSSTSSGGSPEGSGLLALIHPRFILLRSALGAVDRRDLRRLLRDARRAGDERLVELGAIMRAAQRRDRWALARALAGGAAAASAGSPALRYARLWSALWTLGPSHGVVRAEAAALLPRAGELPLPWAADVRHLEELLAMLGGRPTVRHLPEAAEAPLRRHGTLLFVEVSVNGRPPAPFILDTGAATTVVAEAWARRAAIRATEAARESRDAGGRPVRVAGAVLESLQLGGATVSNCPVSVIDLPERFAVAGILSPFDAFRDLGIDLDVVAGVLRLIPAARWREWIAPLRRTAMSVRPFWNEGSLSIPVTVNEHEPAPFLVDTGAGAVLLCEHLARRLGLEAGGPETPSAAAAGSVPVRKGPAVQLRLDRGVARSFDAWMQPCSGNRDRLFPRMVDGYLGVPWFRTTRVLLAPEGRRLFLAL